MVCQIKVRDKRDKRDKSDGVALDDCHSIPVWSSSPRTDVLRHSQPELSILRACDFFDLFVFFADDPTFLIPTTESSS
jgi:hypothetical protein